MLAFCGINCSECPAYKATMAVDEKMMQDVVEKFGEGEQPKTDWVCLGCLHPEPGLIATYCASCEIRACAVERGVTNCAACADYDGCEKLQSFMTEEGGDIAQRMSWLRDAFVARSQSGG